MNQGMKRFLLTNLILLIGGFLYSAERIPIKVNNVLEGAPITMGIPFPQGSLHSPAHVSILD